jgi:hypothetical protein
MVGMLVVWSANRWMIMRVTLSGGWRGLYGGQWMALQASLLYETIACAAFSS